MSIEIPVTTHDPSTLPRRGHEAGVVGGRFVQAPDCFWVDEIPAYLPGGEGEHLYLQIQKEGLNTQDVCRHFQDALSIHPKDVGCAGLKDRKGTTTQWLSFRGVTPAEIEAHPLEGVTLLELAYHRNKLKTGHLRGNRFRLLLGWEIEDETLLLGQALCEQLTRHGMPNFYGPQRFGDGGRNRRDGKRLLRKAMQGENQKKGFRRRLLVSSFQAGLFNDILAYRLSQGLLDTALLGDIMAKHDSGGQFLCEDLAAEQPRVDALAISPTGWMPGYRATMASGQPGEWETALLAREELTAEDFRALGKLAIGTRRPLRVPVGELTLTREGAGALLSFTLPPGSYASVLLHALGISFR